ncbi:MAG: ATP-binding protein [Nitrospiraceae bacterium]
MTGLDDYNSITEAYDAGATDFLTKPLNGLLLIHRVRYIVRSSRVLQELRASQASLAHARDAALEGTRLKSEFLATVNHEIRTPMNGVLGMADLLLDTALTPEQRDYADAIRTSGEALLSIINDILDFSKVESGHLQLQHIEFDLKRLLDDVIGLFAERARRKGINLACSIHAQAPISLCGDPLRLRQVLSNLVSNAVKFTERGEIVIRVDENPKAQNPLGEDDLAMRTSANGNSDSIIRVRFSVADTGIGVAPDAYARIFQPFGQADGSNTRKYGGAGLGLAICRQLVDLMGGVIGVESELDRGSVFHFTIPLERQSDVTLPRPLRKPAAA